MILRIPSKQKNYPLTDLVKAAAKSKIKKIEVKENKNSHAFHGTAALFSDCNWSLKQGGQEQSKIY